eukprot:scaffold1104_cov299-Prasinococcus_capsulatus_cf.AAC.19
MRFSRYAALSSRRSVIKRTPFSRLSPIRAIGTSCVQTAARSLVPAIGSALVTARTSSVFRDTSLFASFKIATTSPLRCLLLKLLDSAATVLACGDISAPWTPAGPAFGTGVVLGSTLLPFPIVTMTLVGLRSGCLK